MPVADTSDWPESLEKASVKPIVTAGQAVLQGGRLAWALLEVVSVEAMINSNRDVRSINSPEAALVLNSRPFKEAVAIATKVSFDDVGTYEYDKYWNGGGNAGCLRPMIAIGNGHPCAAALRQHAALSVRNANSIQTGLTGHAKLIDPAA